MWQILLSWRYNLVSILPLSQSRWYISWLQPCRDASIRGTEVSLESRQTVVARVGRCHTELHHACLWLSRCHTLESQRRALWLRETGRGSGCRTLEETGGLGCCLSPHSGASYSQTTGCCTDCTETRRANILGCFRSSSQVQKEMLFRGMLSLSDTELQHMW